MSDEMDVKSFNESLIEEFRANDGKVGGPFEHAPLVLVTTTGAKSGKPRTCPVVFTRDSDDLVVVASKAGAPTHPDWYHNMVANPTVTVELPGVTYQATAVVTEGDDRASLYAAHAAGMPNFDEYRQMTEREIPVIRLRRA